MYKRDFSFSFVVKIVDIKNRIVSRYEVRISRVDI